MIDTIWLTPSYKRQHFDSQFSDLVNPYVSSYSGRQPIMSWYSDKEEPQIHEDFLNHLPAEIRKKVFNLVKELELISKILQ